MPQKKQVRLTTKENLADILFHQIIFLAKTQRKIKKRKKNFENELQGPDENELQLANNGMDSKDKAQLRKRKRKQIRKLLREITKDTCWLDAELVHW